ncbi:hypothetical protein, partial [Stenotrophomonas maltophilia]|uniref:hypothetical protein n=1 Tax=Stenotrophomonas maltophilia TaxID=40324 RepID=UPI00313C5CB9
IVGVCWGWVLVVCVVWGFCWGGFFLVFLGLLVCLFCLCCFFFWGIGGGGYVFLFIILVAYFVLSGVFFL